MTNQELDQLTELAADISQSVDRLLLDGDGNFVRLNDPAEVVPASDVLRMLAVCERKAYALHHTLAALPRRKAATKQAGGAA